MRIEHCFWLVWCVTGCVPLGTGGDGGVAEGVSRDARAQIPDGTGVDGGGLDASEGDAREDASGVDMRAQGEGEGEGEGDAGDGLVDASASRDQGPPPADRGVAPAAAAVAGYPSSWVHDYHRLPSPPLLPPIL